MSSAGWIEADADLLAGRAPESRCRFFPDHIFDDGFHLDQEVWTEEELRRDPYFQEFLRPRGVFFHARARLWSDPGERVSISLKRRSRLGPYGPAEVAILDSLMPELRAMVFLARRLLDAEVSGMVRAFRGSGDPAFELDAAGRVRRLRGDGFEDCGIIVRNRRLAAVDRLSQKALDEAVSAAVRQPALAAVTDQGGERRFLRIVPVSAGARDVFLATAAIAMVIAPARRAARIGAPGAGMREAFGLTAREAEIACLLAQGLSLAEAAGRLLVGVGTARNHLKSIFAKTGTRRQGELVSLLCRVGS